MDFLDDPEDLQALIEYLESGAQRDIAFRAVGASKEQYAKFMRAARDGESPHVELLEDFERAEAKGECLRLKVVAKSKDWRANMTSLERQFPDKYGQKVQVEVKQQLEQVFSVVEANTTASQFESILAQISGLGHGQNAVGAEEKPGPAVH